MSDEVIKIVTLNNQNFRLSPERDAKGATFIASKIMDGPVDGYFIPRLDLVEEYQDDIRLLIEQNSWLGFYGGKIN